MACSKSRLLINEHFKYSRMYLRGSNLWNEMIQFTDKNDLWEEFEEIKDAILHYIDGHPIGGDYDF